MNSELTSLTLIGTALMQTELHYYTHTLNCCTVILTVSNVGDDAAAVRDKQSERLGGMTLQTDTRAHPESTHIDMHTYI